MARRKRSSKVLEKADRRIASLRSISPNLNLGNGLTVDTYTTLITDMRDKLAAYNTVLSTVDNVYSDMLMTEHKLGDYSELLLLGVATKYGKSSDEYEMAGGVKKTERKRSTRKVSSVPKAAIIADFPDHRLL